MKTIEWKVVLTDKNQIASAEKAQELPQDEIESHLIIIGLLDHLKQKHMDKLKTLYTKTIRKGDKDVSDL
jgi:hypothetical protein